MSLESVIRKYLKSFEEEYEEAKRSGQHTPELSFRPALHTLLCDLADLFVGPGNVITILEPRTQNKAGRPDWRIHERQNLGVYGYIEAKGLSLGTFDYHEHIKQFEKYLALGHRLVITDGIEFAYQFPGEERITVVSIIDKHYLASTNWKSRSITDGFRLFVNAFYEAPNPSLSSEGELVEQIALRARNLANEICDYIEIDAEEACDDEELAGILVAKELREFAIGDIPSGFAGNRPFAEYAAQSIMFDLWYAHRLLCSDQDAATTKEEKLTAYLSSEEPSDEYNPFHKLAKRAWRNDSSFIYTWMLECVQYLSFVHVLDAKRLRPDYQKLYESFLLSFSRGSRFDYGAYYTPLAISNALIEMLDLALQETCGCTLADNDSGNLLDPCCGTASLIEAAMKKGVSGTRLNGFEILPAPYALADYRMHAVSDGDDPSSMPRLCLVNSLSDYLYESQCDDDSVEGSERLKAKNVMRNGVSVIIGSLPCAESSQIANDAEMTRILSLMDDFRPARSRRRSNLERQINNLWHEFFRWICAALEPCHSTCAIALVMPTSFLENESFRPAREYLLSHFANIYALEVDGASRSGVRADNLFRTQQGRSLVVAVRSERVADETAIVHHNSIVSLSREDKEAYLLGINGFALTQFRSFDPSEADSYSFCPSQEFDHEKYALYWPLESDNEPAIFAKNLSGIKLSPVALFVHVKDSMLKRRTREVARNARDAAAWFDGWDRAPQQEALKHFADYWNISRAQQNAELSDSCKEYSLRPFLTASALLNAQLVRELARVGGGGTRLRPDLFRAFSVSDTFGIAVSKAPKDQHEVLKQFSSFCWHYPDNDLCRRGSSRIYCNKFVDKRTGNDQSNITDDATFAVLHSFGYSGDRPLRDSIVFYVYAFLCSRVYLDEFEGALFTVSRIDQSPRIPLVADRDVFDKIVHLGEQLAELEQTDYEPGNLLGFDYAALSTLLPQGFELQVTDDLYNQEVEILTLKSRTGETLEIPCPKEIMDITIGGYNVVKNVWLKFYSYNYTHCVFAEQDLMAFLDLLNRLATYLSMLDDVDSAIREVLEGKFDIVRPAFHEDT